MTPLVLIVGFLGSGKTTLLKTLLPGLNARQLRPKVIINDYQNAQVDAEQLLAFSQDVEAISGDCVCCGSRDELLSALATFEHGPGRLALIETNGTTDSENLIELLALESSLKHFAPPIQISLIDVQRWQKRLWHNRLEREQARSATHLVLSHLENVPPARLEKVEASLLHHKIQGRRITATALADELSRLSAELADQSPQRQQSSEHDSHHHHHHHPEENEHHFASLELPLPSPIPQAALETLLKDLPEEVLRCKGLARLTEDPETVMVFQKVDRKSQVQFFPLAEAPRDLSPLILFIGPRLPQDILRAAVKKLEGPELAT